MRRYWWRSLLDAVPVFLLMHGLVSGRFQGGVVPLHEQMDDDTDPRYRRRKDRPEGKREKEGGKLKNWDHKIENNPGTDVEQTHKFKPRKRLLCAKSDRTKRRDKNTGNDQRTERGKRRKGVANTSNTVQQREVRIRRETNTPARSDKQVNQKENQSGTRRKLERRNDSQEKKEIQEKREGKINNEKNKSKMFKLVYLVGIERDEWMRNTNQKIVNKNDGRYYMIQNKTRMIVLRNCITDSWLIYKLYERCLEDRFVLKKRIGNQILIKLCRTKAFLLRRIGSNTQKKGSKEGHQSELNGMQG